MDELALSYYMIGDIQKAHDMTVELLRRIPDDARIANNLHHYRDKMSRQKKRETLQKHGEIGGDAIFFSSTRNPRIN